MKGTFGAVTEEGCGILRRVRKYGYALTELITSMLDLSRLEAGRLPVYVQEVRTPTLFEELKDETREICEPTGLDVMWQGEQTLPVLYTDIGKLKVVIKNLLSNAFKFTSQGRIISTSATPRCWR